MTLRIFRFLLSVFLLAVLSTCSTTSSRPVSETPVEQAPPSRTETRDHESQDRGQDIQRDLSDRSLAEVVALLNEMPDHQPDVALKILRTLESVSSSQLIAMIDSQQLGPELTEWLDLSLHIRTTLINRGSFAVASREWVQRNDRHTITQTDFSQLISRYSAMFPAPFQVAVLLPTEGGLATAARAIRDGILGAYLEQPGNSVIRFYSSGKSSQSAIAAYLQAREDGATQIIGPLRIGSTRALASLGDLSVPILLLNQSASNGPVNPGHTSIVNSLSLSQTDEAAAIAVKALAQGQKKAILIVPDNAWGMRIETAFATTFEQGEGKISAIAHFNTTANDHSAMLTQLLKIDESKQRKEDLQFRLGIPLTYEPSHRDDFDFIFLAATPSQGRDLKPLLRFHDVGNVPVYAMGRIFRGGSDRATDQDLNGIVFPVTPWQLEVTGDTTPMLDSIRGGVYGNLYALGQDAWHLLPWLPLMQKDPDLSFPGDTGKLHLKSNGDLYRQPAWAQFSAGRPRLYQWPGTH
jgi:outer membrane PBP1 activator LpoA protein